MPISADLASSRCLALLLIDPGRFVPTDALVDELWATEPPDGAATTIRRHLRVRLRHALGDAAPIARLDRGLPDRDPASGLVDRTVFEQTIRQSRRGLSGTNAHVWHADGFSQRAGACGVVARSTGLADDGALARRGRSARGAAPACARATYDARHRARTRAVRASTRSRRWLPRYPYRERLWRSADARALLTPAGRPMRSTHTSARGRCSTNSSGIEPSAEYAGTRVAILRQEVPPVIRAERSRQPAGRR